MAKQIVVDEKSDGLEIISIGKLYQGHWEKKYWSSSRGKSRYPYPVGYGAIRIFNGITYKMEILDGLKGPDFVISSMDGQSYSGQTPDIAWEGFQKKSCLRIKLPRGKRFSCKIDGVELFGFKNPSVRRLLQGLVAKSTETAEKSFQSSSFGNQQSEETYQHDIQVTAHCTETYTDPDLQLDLDKTHVKGKRSGKHKEGHPKSINEAKSKRARPRCWTQSDDGPHASQSCQGNHKKGISSASSASNEHKAGLEAVVDGGNKLNHSLSAGDGHGLHLDSSNSSEHLEKEKCLVAQEASNSFISKSLMSTEEDVNLFKNKEILHRSTITSIEGFSFSLPGKEEGEISVLKDSEMLSDMDFRAPENFALPSDSTYTAEMEIPKESTCTVNDKLNAAQIFISEDSISEPHALEEIVIVAANQKSEKSDFDPVGQEIDESMMTVLLPQALPLLETFSVREKASPSCVKNPLHGPSLEGKGGANCYALPEFTTRSSSEQSQLKKQNGEVHIPEKHFNEDFQDVKQKENYQIPSTDVGSLVASLGCSISTVPDSFEQDLCDIMEYTWSSQFQDAGEADRNSSATNLCTHEEHNVYHNNKQSEQVCDVQTATSKTSFCCDDVQWIMEKGPQKGGNFMNDPNLGITSPSKDAPIHSYDSTSLQMSPEQTDIKIYPCCIEGTAGSVDVKSGSAECNDLVAQKRIGGVTRMSGAGSVSIVSIPNIANSTCHSNAPHSESIICTDIRGDVASKICSVSKERSYEELLSLHKGRSPLVSNSRSCDMDTVTSHQDYIWSPSYRNTSNMVCTSGICGGKLQTSGYNDVLEVDGSISGLQELRVDYHDMNEKKETRDKSVVNSLPKMMHNGKLENMFEPVGNYVHPMPISMVLLRTKGIDMYICVLCGYLMENDKTLFIYKVSTKGERRGCPALIGHATVISPISRDAFSREGLLDSSGLQFTPDGKCLVLLNSIKAPYCSKRNINCPCSVCTSACFEKEAVKVVQVKHGYIEVLAKLRTAATVCCILVCEPSHLVAAEESGRLHLWTMNSTWSAHTEENYLPKPDCMLKYIVELKRIPNLASLVVGHNAVGDFFLWDLSRRILISKFSASRTSFFGLLPIRLFRCPSQASVAIGACGKEQIASIIDETRTWSSETGVTHGSLPVKEEDVSVVILVSAILDLDHQNSYPLNNSGGNPIGCWSLALLAKSKLVLENALDPSAAMVGASAGYGIIGTLDGFLYVWELSTGKKLGYLSHCRGAVISCFAADDSNSGAFAVTVDGSQLQVYSYSPEAPAT